MMSSVIPSTLMLTDYCRKNTSVFKFRIKKKHEKIIKIQDQSFSQEDSMIDVQYQDNGSMTESPDDITSVEIQSDSKEISQKEIESHLTLIGDRGFFVSAN